MTFCETLRGEKVVADEPPPYKSINNNFLKKTTFIEKISMTQAYPCFLSIGKISSKYRHFPFTEDKVTIGRSTDVTYSILSPLISRCHAIIQKQEDGSWTVTDNKSLNGIAVNGKRLAPDTPYTLQDGDTVQIGVPPTPDTPAEFIYRFFTSLKVRRERGSKGKRSSAEGEEGSPAKRHKMQEGDVSESKGAEDKNTQEQAEEEARKKAEQDARREEESRRQAELKADYEEQLKAMARQLKEKEEEAAHITEQLERERQERQAVEEKQKQQEERVSELDAKQRQLMEEAAAVEQQMRKELEEKLQEREELLRTQMQHQLASLASEKQQVENRLQQEMEKAVQEKDRELQDRLEAEKERLRKIIETKELEQKALESQLAESRVENERAKADTLTTREAILSEFAETMETELQCTICNELFIKATSLNCSHAFCALCIRQWLKVKKECPNCRAAVASQMRSIVLDNYIDRVVEQLSAEMKERRAQMVAERKDAEAKMDAAEKQQKAGTSAGTATAVATTTGRGRGRQNQRGGARTRGRGRGGAAATATTAAAARAATAAGRGRGVAGAPPLPRITTDQEIMNLLQGVAHPTAIDPAQVEDAAGAPEVAATVTVDSEPAIDLTAADDDPDTVTVSDDEDEDEDDDEVDSDDSDRYYRRRYDRFDGFGSDSDLSDEDDEEFERGDPDAYYGGYGRCYRCGMRGHWANGCPNN